MALIPGNTYPGKINPPSAAYPLGSARNVTTPSDGTGTPLQANWVNDLWGLLQGLLVSANVTANGQPDTALSSQYFEALTKLFSNQTAVRLTGATLSTGQPNEAQADATFTMPLSSDEAQNSVVDIQVFDRFAPLTVTVNCQGPDSFADKDGNGGETLDPQLVILFKKGGVYSIANDAAGKWRV